VVVLTTNCFKVENHFQKVYGTNDDYKSNSDAPEDKIYVDAYVEKFCGGRGGQGFHIIVWLLTPRQIPNEEMGKRRRNGHVLSSGSTICSEGCKVAACIVLIRNVQLNQQ
jgi:hypothetical protein